MTNENRGTESTVGDEPTNPAEGNSFTGPTWNTGPPIPRFAIRTNVLNARAQLFDAFFRRVASGYAHIFPRTARRVIEFGFLLQAFFVLAIFIHLHIMFIRSPITCLDHLTDPAVDSPTRDAKRNLPSGSGKMWSRYGVLRVEVIRNPTPEYSLADSYAKEFYGTFVDRGDGVIDGDEVNESFNPDQQVLVKSELLKPVSSRQKLLQHFRQLWTTMKSFPHAVYNYISQESNTTPPATPTDATDPATQEEKTLKAEVSNETLWLWMNQLSTFVNCILVFFHNLPAFFINRHEPISHENNYIMEYAVEYGFLRLSPAMRKHFNVNVEFVVLDPDKDACFGGPVSRFLMEEFLGYDDLLLGSIKNLAMRESVRGHMVNVITGQHYRLVSGRANRSSYIVAVLVMSLFTFCVSVLLRYSSHQLVVVIADLLQIFEGNLSVGIPGTPFMTVILALVAMETIMSEFFGDSFTAFYVIFIVSLCDHYEAVFCRTPISRQYWPRFFYIYQFVFYAYHYRFNGQLSGLALWVSWLFTLHSMIYFFHHYELRNVLHDWTFRELFAQVTTHHSIPTTLSSTPLTDDGEEQRGSPTAVSWEAQWSAAGDTMIMDNVLVRAMEQVAEADEQWRGDVTTTTADGSATSFNDRQPVATDTNSVDQLTCQQPCPSEAPISQHPVPLSKAPASPVPTATSDSIQ